VDQEERRLIIRLRNLRFARAIAAADAGEVVEDVERPRTRFDDVIGADGAKEELKFFIDYLKNPRRFAALGLKPPKGVLLHGPPGTGKTMLARAMAGESDVAFLSASASTFVTIWQGSGPQNVRDLFARARRYAPAIIFIDEIDAIGRVRTGGAGGAQATENTLNALLTEMDGFTSPSADRPVFILAATNFEVESEDQSSPQRSSRALDPALVRRFSRTILVDLPDRSAREKYLVLRLTGRSACHVPEEIIKLIAERSSGMSIANLESIIETAARNAAKTGSPLTGKLLEEAFETVRFGEARPRSAEVVQRTAWHEAGHTILYCLAGYWPPYVTIVSRGDHGGYMARSAEELERRAGQTRDELLAGIRVSLAGRAAEQLIYGPEGGLSTGASGDLEHATQVARQMVCRYGMDDQFGLVVTPELMKYEGALSSPMYVRVNEAAGKILQAEMDRTRKLLEENRAYLEAVTQALIEQERLTAEDLQKILPEIPLPAAQTWRRPDVGNGG
jgi:ATP-dependent metalloprotease FtsH